MEFCSGKESAVEYHKIWNEVNSVGNLTLLVKAAQILLSIRLE